MASWWSLALTACMIHSVISGRTEVSIFNNQFYINGKITNAGSDAAGLLLNSRMTQAIFNDENPATQSNWAYPDTHVWNATRNTMECISNISLFNSKGLNAITVGMQGSDPDPTGKHNSDCIVSAFTSNGSLKSDWVYRLTQIIQMTDEVGMVVILNFFDQSQEGRISSGDTYIYNAIFQVGQFLNKMHASNVIVDLADACNNAYTHQALTPNAMGQLIEFTKNSIRVLTSSSFPPGVVPPNSVLAVADFILLHATGLNRTGLTTMVKGVKSSPAFYQRNNGHGVPIIINMDSTDMDNLSEAMSDGVSWGFYSQGLNNYVDGYCSPPVNWGLNTIDKTSFFNEVGLYTGSK